MQQDTKKKKKKSGGFAALVILVIAVVNNLVEAIDNRELENAGIAVLIGIALLTTVIVLIKILKGRATETSTGYRSQPEHSHDRLHPAKSSAVCDDDMTHWKKQLDGFLAAGIIERSEYKTLLERYRRQTMKKDR